MLNPIQPAEAHPPPLGERVDPCATPDPLNDGAARRLLQGLPDAVLCVNRDWRVTYANDEALRLTGMSMADLQTKDLWNVYQGTEGSIFERSCRSAMETQRSDQFEYFYPSSAKWLAFTILPSDDGLSLLYRDVTVRRQKAHELAQHCELLTIIQRTSLTATWDYDVETDSVTFGAGSYPVLGRPFDELQSFTEIERIIYPPDVPAVVDAVARACEGAPLLIEFRVTAPDGRRIWIESRGSAIIKDGRTTHLRGLSFDITERKKSEDALVASENRYRVLADLNPQAIWMGAPDGSILYANQNFLDYIGLTPETIGGLGWLNAFFSEDRERVLERWAASVLTGVDYEIQARMVRASDGAVRYWSLRALPVRDETGAILHWLGVAADIHDSLTAGEAVHEKHLQTERQRAELETVYQTAPVGLALFDPVELRCLRVNERQAEILGLPSDQVLGRTLAEIAPMPGLEEMFRDAVRGRPVRNQVFEGELATRPGEHRVWNVSLSPVYGEGSTESGGAATVQAITSAWLEITHLKRAEAALVQSEKLAAVGRLASSISHEINNPLEAITNLLYLIAHHQDLPDELKVFVHMAQSELGRVSQIATQTLRFHRQALRPTWVSAGELIDAVVNLYQGRLANSGIKVRASYSTDTRVLCFENDIRQVLNNLIANAIDAMRGGGQLIVRAHQAHNPHTGSPGIRLTIADTGHGMSGAVQRRIFEPFFTTKDMNGTGLGLWISEGIVQRHHGRLTVKSSQGERIHGTVFTLFLPTMAASEAEVLAA